MIFYFSGTGNTRWAAMKLAEATGEDTVFIPDVRHDSFKPKLSEGERIGFCFPVHGWRPPTIVREFIRNLQIGNAADRYVYSLVTAGDNIGETIDIVRKELKSKGLPLHAACSLIMPESYVGLPFMDVDTKEKEQQKISAAAKKLEWFAKVVTKKEKGAEDLVRGNWPKTNSRLIGAVFYKFLINDKPFHVSEEKCIGCGKCANVCSVGNIEMENDKLPQWKHNGDCMTCFSCYHHCPTHAIEFGNRTKKKGQYFFKQKTK